MPRKSKAAQRRSDAARRGWVTRERNLHHLKKHYPKQLKQHEQYLKESRTETAKKGWATRRRNERARQRKEHWGVEIEIGYNGSEDNSYALVVHIRVRRRLSDDDIASLVEQLAQDGHFDPGAPGNVTASGEARIPYPPDYDWVSLNAWEITKRGLRIKKGTARLMAFERRAPGSLP